MYDHIFTIFIMKLCEVPRVKVLLCYVLYRVCMSQTEWYWRDYGGQSATVLTMVFDQLEAAFVW